MGRNSTKKNKERVSKNKEKEVINKKGVKEKFAEMLELPKELVLNRPKLIMIGNCDILIENYKWVIEYSPDCLRISTGSGIVRLKGTELLIKEITSEDIIVSGVVHTLEFINAG